MHYFILTFGCQANKSDSERIEGDYQARGYSKALTWQTADEIVINTCAVRQRAEDRVRGFLQNVSLYFQKNNQPKPKIILKTINLRDIPDGKKEINLKGCKILAEGELKQKITIKASAASKSAIDKIKKAGSDIILED